MTAFARYYEDDEPIQDLYYYVKNAQGDITDITDDRGNIIASYTYDPWGKILSVTGTNTTIGNLNPFRYRSYYYDSDIQMYYLQSRYYDPETGRFLNTDAVDFLGATKTLLSYNAFAYCENDVVNMVDPSGKILYEAIRFMYSSPIGFLDLGFYNPNANNLRDFFNQPWSTKHYCAQKMVGYCDAYDVIALAMGCFIHCAKSEFYYRGKWWRVELWMGRYGISVGQLIKTQQATMNILRRYYNSYSDLF